MSDRAVLVLCVVVLAAACAARPVPVWAGLALAAGGLIGRRSALLVIGAGLLASGLSAGAWAGLAPPRSAPVEGRAVLAGDPVAQHGAIRVVATMGRRRVELWARGEPAVVLRPLLGGEHVLVQGRLRPVPPTARRWLAPRHVSARVDVAAARSAGPGSPASRLANGLRRTLHDGARHLDAEHRSLLLGVVLGDDRELPPPLRDAFRDAGLSHLTAVSGQNVAFVLVLAGPVLRRLGLRSRWLGTLAVIGFFGLLTRWEPSVLRAGAMAAIACTATAAGRPTGRVRLLALAVTAAVLVDPLLVHALGFRLSVGATAGIALFAGPVQRRLPGPPWLAEPLAVTLAAQIGVAPIAIPTFGSLPLASLPANLLAVPTAAPLTLWGLTGGLAAGVLGDRAAGLLHLPTRLLAGWLAGVAAWASELPLGAVGPGPAAGVAAAVGLVGLGRWAMRRPLGSARWSWPWDRTASTSPPGPS